MSRPFTILFQRKLLPAWLLCAAGWATYFALNSTDPTPQDLPVPLRPITVLQHKTDAIKDVSDHILNPAPDLSQQCRRTGQIMLGMLPLDQSDAEQPDLPFWQRLIETPSVYGYYRLGSDTIHLASEDQSILRHEWIHALHDQYGNLTAQFRNARTTDQKLAVRSVLEGTAVLFASGETPEGTPSRDLDRNAYHLAYRVAPEYVAKASDGDLIRAFSLRPSTTYEIFFQRPRSPVAIGAPETLPDEQIRCTDQVGVLGLLTTLVADGSVSQNDYLPILSSWAGDRLDVIERNGQQRVVWQIALRDKSAREAFLRGPAFSIPLTRPATRVLVLQDSLTEAVTIP